MHCKFTQTNSDYLLEFAPEWSSCNNQLRHAKSQQMEGRSSDSESDIFYGFQTIRTDEKDLSITDLETPKFAMHVENMTKNETRTKDELKLVNEKLEKLLSSDDNINNEAIANPVQHYVVGSKAGLPKTTIVKEGRTSLWELFQKTKTADKTTDRNINIRKQTEKKSVNSVKTMLKKISSTASVGNIYSAAADEKLQKIVRLLHRFQPEVSDISQKSKNLWKHVTNSNCADEYIIRIPYRAICETNAINQTKNKVCNPVYGVTNCRRECWIKSDAEYLILEL